MELQIQRSPRHFALKTGGSSVLVKGNFTPAKRWLVAAQLVGRQVPIALENSLKRAQNMAEKCL